MSNDIAISPTMQVPIASVMSVKPCYLVLLENGKTFKKFISIDRPDLLNGFLQVKGFFSDMSEDEIINNYQNILTSIKKDIIIEIMFPWHKINSVRSLIFKAK